MVASSRENFSANWTVSASRTSIPRQTRRSRMGWPNVLSEKGDHLDGGVRQRHQRAAREAGAMLFVCDVTNKSVTTSTGGGKSPYELWFGNFPTADHLRPFGAVGYARRSVREHKMAPKGEKCVFMGIPRNFPTGTVSVLLVSTRKIVERPAVTPPAATTAARSRGRWNHCRERDSAAQ